MCVVCYFVGRDRCVLSVVCRVLSIVSAVAVCCSVFAVRCLPLFVMGCLVCLGVCLQFAACSKLFVASLVLAVRCLLPAV